MTVWRPITAEGVGYAGLLSDAIAGTEAANPDLLWPVDEGVQFIVSDYSGQHRCQSASKRDPYRRAIGTPSWGS
ncbi:hypothetical protein BH10PSE1_BH10PSE1_32890 [soil metagenome]